MLINFFGDEAGRKTFSAQDIKVYAYLYPVWIRSTFLWKAVEMYWTFFNRDTSQFHGQISTVSVTANSQQFTQSSIDSVQILHYRSISSNQNSGNLLSEFQGRFHERHGELIFRPLLKSSSMLRLIVHSEVPFNCILSNPNLSIIRLILFDISNPRHKAWVHSRHTKSSYF